MAASNQARFHAASDQSLLVYLGEGISLEANRRVLQLLRSLESRPIAGVRNTIPAYNSLLVVFDSLRLRHDQLEELLRQYLAHLTEEPFLSPPTVEIPVCYGGEFGPDLDAVASAHAMTPQEVIELHSSGSYNVYFLGFAPGFAYLGGLPESLATPRLAPPRKKVPAGSVGIGGTQTGIYPFATPGGWRLIGRTPLTMFRPDRRPMSLLSLGDQVRFAPISNAEFARLASASA